MSSRTLWGILIFTITGVTAFAAVRPQSAPAPAAPAAQNPLLILGKVPEFTLIDQKGQTFHSGSLKGRPWIADFIFTSCAGQCPEMTSKMAQLQHLLPEEIHLVSITVDPANDNPAKLFRYAQSYGAQEGRWHFLTGDHAAIEKIVRDGFRLSYAEGGPPQEPITHSARLVLVDGSGAIRNYCDSSDPDAISQLAREATALLKERR